MERRELARGDGHPGLAKSQFFTVHADYDYDINVDTFKYNPEECALQIKEMRNLD
ncbi:phosphotransferase-like protein [Paenibacillus uliginis]|uniref:phosphotransferase-like protein n=1 Tax=Paenibacillus uliginis TaxID=683737 RepID=UPI001AD84AEE